MHTVSVETPLARPGTARWQLTRRGWSWRDVVERKSRLRMDCFRADDPSSLYFLLRAFDPGQGTVGGSAKRRVHYKRPSRCDELGMAGSSCEALPATIIASLPFSRPRSPFRSQLSTAFEQVPWAQDPTSDLMCILSILPAFPLSNIFVHR